MYPHASKNARNTKSTSICGTKPRTAPTPATIPSRINACSQSAQPIAFNALSTRTGTPGTEIPKKLHPSPNTPSFAQSVAHVPTVVTDT